jgi:hypothetical protein
MTSHVRRTAAPSLLLALVVAAPAAGQSYFERPVGPAYCEPTDARIPVLLLGSYHMANPGADAFNLEADDVLLPVRQKEIAAAVERLAGFRPTHVAVEAPWGDEAIMDGWREVKAGERELRRSEEEQIGFRLAMQLGHETIYPIDYRMGLDFESLNRPIALDPALGDRMERVQTMGEEAMEMMGQWLHEGSVGRMLYRMNEPDNLARAHWPYVEIFLGMVAGDDYAGAEVIGDWYERNLRIFANLLRTANAPGDRVFVVFGQGHIPILRQLVIDHPGYCLEDPLPYLDGL